MKDTQEDMFVKGPIGDQFPFYLSQKTAEEVRATLAHNLELLIASHKLNKQEVAKGCKMGYGRFLDFTIGRRYATIKDLTKICNYFQVTMGDLLDGYIGLKIKSKESS